MVVPVEDNSEKISAAKKNVGYWSRGLKCTSWTLVIIGAISTLSCIWAFFTAFSKTQRILHTQENPNVTEKEFSYYDSLRNVAVVGVILSLCQLSLGKKGLITIKSGTEKKFWAKGAFRKSVVALAILMIMTMIATHICHGLHRIRTAGHENEKPHHAHVNPYFPNPKEEESQISHHERAPAIPSYETEVDYPGNDLTSAHFNYDDTSVNKDKCFDWCNSRDDCKCAMYYSRKGVGSNDLMCYLKTKCENSGRQDRDEYHTVYIKDSQNGRKLRKDDSAPEQRHKHGHHPKRHHDKPDGDDIATEWDYEPKDKRHAHHKSEVKGIYGTKKHDSKKKSHSSIGSIVMVLFYCAHMWFLRKVLHWQKEVKDLGGKIESKMCCKFERKCNPPVAAQPVFQPISPMTYVPEVAPPNIETRTYQPVASASQVLPQGSNIMN